MAEIRRYITDVKEACALREAGLLWRDPGPGALGPYVPTDNWYCCTLLDLWDDLEYGFFILLEE